MTDTHSMLDTELFGRAPQPNTIAELFEILNSCRRKQSNKVRIWRGQGDIRWPIHSGAYRRIALDHIELSEDEVQRYERRLLDEATHRGFRSFEGRELSDLELLARLQHHGAATRLIDASRSALVALWFAVADRPRETGALFGIHSDYLGGGEGEPDFDTYEEIMGRCADLAHPMTWEPSGVSPRIAAQHAQFLYSAVSHKKSGSLRLADYGDAALVIALTPTVKEECREMLCEVYDIHMITLFPDIDGFSKANGTEYTQWANYRW